MSTDRVLGIDYGTKKIGLALSNGGLVIPMEILENREDHQIGEEALDKIIQYIETENISVVVVGLPSSNDIDSPELRKIREFGNKLKKSSKQHIDINYVDESYTSKEAIQKSIDYGISQKDRGMDDSIAACQILQRYLEAHSLPN